MSEYFGNSHRTPVVILLIIGIAGNHGCWRFRYIH